MGLRNTALAGCLLPTGTDLLIVEDGRAVNTVGSAIVRAVEQRELDRIRLVEAAGRVRNPPAGAVLPRCPEVPSQVHRNRATHA